MTPTARPRYGPAVGQWGSRHSAIDRDRHDDLLAKKSAHHRAYLEPYATGEPKIVAKLEGHREHAHERVRTYSSGQP